MTIIKEFTDLFVWQEGHKLVLIVYRITKGFPKTELYALVDQMRRAVTSVTSNIAEGFGRQTFKEKIRFYYLAKGSLIEVKNQVYISRDVGYLKTEDFKILMDQIEVVQKLLQGFITKTKTLASV